MIKTIYIKEKYPCTFGTSFCKVWNFILVRNVKNLNIQENILEKEVNRKGQENKNKKIIYTL